MDMSDIVARFNILNAWVLAVPVWLVGIIIARLDRRGMKRAMDMSWYKPIDKLASAGSLFSLMLFMVITVFIELKYDSWTFLVGILMVISGALGHFTAKIEYMHTPANAAATGGVYRISRNPMYAFLLLAFLGVVVCSRSIILGVIWGVMVFFTHLLIIGEERYCLRTYGESYGNYMKKVSRYFVFL
jgi:protein-S-isoprenylcysteine O-methyltransferase Ste14